MNYPHTDQNLRLACLQLAAAHPSDRDWILMQLEAGAKARIETLLSEISGAFLRNGATLDHNIINQLAMNPATENSPQSDNPESLFWVNWLLQDKTALTFDEQLRLETLSAQTACPETLTALILPPAMRASLLPRVTSTGTAR